MAHLITQYGALGALESCGAHPAATPFSQCEHCPGCGTDAARPGSCYCWPCGALVCGGCLALHGAACPLCGAAPLPWPKEGGIPAPRRPPTEVPRR